MKIPVPMGLRARIMALFCGGVIAAQLLTVLTILYGIPGTSYIGEYRQKRMDTFLELGTAADLKKADVERWIRNIRNEALKFTWSNTTRRAVDRILPSGRVGRPAGPVRENLRILKEIVGFFGNEQTTYRSIRIADARDGAIVFSSVPSEIGRNLSGDELGVLGRTFNDMVRRVQGWYGELHLEVAARTAELSLANESLQKEIAERRKAEEARERTNAELEEKVRGILDSAA